MFRYLLMFFLCYPLLAVGQQIPDAPSNYVTDLADALTQSEEEIMNDSLQAFEERSGNQLFILVSNSLGGRDIDELGTEVAEKWKVGKRGVDNGILVSVFIQDRKTRIDVGYGLEGFLTDLETQQIQREKMNPEFKKGDYFQGLFNGMMEMIYETDDSYRGQREEMKGIEAEKEDSEERLFFTVDKMYSVGEFAGWA